MGEHPCRRDQQDLRTVPPAHPGEPGQQHRGEHDHRHLPDRADRDHQQELGPVLQLRTEVETRDAPRDSHCVHQPQPPWDMTRRAARRHRKRVNRVSATAHPAWIASCAPAVRQWDAADVDRQRHAQRGLERQESAQRDEPVREEPQRRVHTGQQVLREDQDQHRRVVADRPEAQLVQQQHDVVQDHLAEEEAQREHPGHSGRLGRVHHPRCETDQIAAERPREAVHLLAQRPQGVVALRRQRAQVPVDDRAEVHVLEHGVAARVLVQLPQPGGQYGEDGVGDRLALGEARGGAGVGVQAVPQGRHQDHLDDQADQHGGHPGRRVQLTERGDARGAPGMQNGHLRPPPRARTPPASRLPGRPRRWRHPSPRTAR